MRATCPDCGVQAHVSAFFVEDDAKRLIALVAEMPPDLGRALISYLSLFKPAKTALQLKRAHKLASELQQLVVSGSVCRDERGGVRRPATPAMWAAGIEQMLVQRAALTLPLDTHNYLLAIVFGLADKADAVVERQTEASARVGKHLTSVSGKKANGEDKLLHALDYINQQEGYGAFTPERAAQERIEARAKYGSPA